MYINMHMHTTTYVLMHACTYLHLTLYFSLLVQHPLNNHNSNTDVPHVNTPSTMIEYCTVLQLLSPSEKYN